MVVVKKYLNLQDSSLETCSRFLQLSSTQAEPSLNISHTPRQEPFFNFKHQRL
jgi:hypothetical protein